MENTDNTIYEMQEQLKQLRNKLQDQRIVNDRMFRNVYRQGLDKLRLKSYLLIIVAVFAMLGLPIFHTFGGVSYIVIAAFELMMLICIVAEIITMQHIPDPGKDLMTATRELTTYRKIYVNWIKFGLPVLVILLIWLCLDVYNNSDIESVKKTGFIVAVLSGATVGAISGLIARRKRINEAEDLLSQIEQLQQE
jgi:hypothetical protein